MHRDAISIIKISMLGEENRRKFNQNIEVMRINQEIKEIKITKTFMYT